MKFTARAVLLGMLVVAASATCVRLGFWQLARMRQKHAIHSVQRALLERDPIDVASALPHTAPEMGARARVRGRWDHSAIILLSGRTHLGAAGVSLVSGVRLDSGELVIVERGWIEAADARTAHPESIAASDSVADVTGVVLPLEHALDPVTKRPGAPTPWAELSSEHAGTRLWSARALEADSTAARFAGTVATWMVRELPGSERAPGAPIAEPYVVPDESMHLSYAIQWFGFALIISGGSLALALKKRA